MQRFMLKSKLHRARVTDANLHYEGSITIDEGLMEAADIVPYEQVAIYNVTNGERFTTYAIKGERGSGVICLNGAAAHKASKGHIIIIATYVTAGAEELRDWSPKCVLLDENNAIKSSR
ncbi:MAG TPA: aspartate 1-decarboxylase [Syntrophales bacterium]|nr:aspartate 1-decarboxylase [Syntrophales bacterium]HOM07656.1 aspartate 1-decarboxylase [Syntrophales bacterium]HOO00307.1 aspartate 1-decarboxylase [Syntrophales bacterium]HPC01203.1 aspartate 1-decarboxylase [Syntrophales bacterium]HPQ07202.1 aspartate 1-decarboxylase [Syntrophales bacterium]